MCARTSCRSESVLRMSAASTSSRGFGLGGGHGPHARGTRSLGRPPPQLPPSGRPERVRVSATGSYRNPFGNIDPFDIVSAPPAFVSEYEVEDGVFQVKLLDEDSVKGAARVLLQSDLLNESSTPDSVEDYLAGTIGAYPAGAFLVGQLLPGEDVSQPSEGATEGVLAVVGLSLTEDTRKRDATLTAPADAGYVSELAVDRDYRRRGLGSVMLRAAEELTMQQRKSGVSLHVRIDKPHLLELYNAQGYVTLRKELFGWRRRALLYKALATA